VVILSIYQNLTKGWIIPKPWNNSWHGIPHRSIHFSVFRWPGCGCFLLFSPLPPFRFTWARITTGNSTR
jgi:hypothetical protein